MPASVIRLRSAVGLIIALVMLLAAYLPTLQTIPNGSDHYYMIDVGETQVVLNVWGTLHATGYPHYVLTGSTLVALLRAFGVDAVLAPALVSLLWGLLALAVIYGLALHLTGRVWPAAALMVLFGLTRTVWIHQVIAEIYTFGLLLLALLFLIALWRTPLRGRIYWLALLGGVGVAHHRALILVAPALVYAVWDELTAEPAHLPRKLVFALLLGLVGFVPYIYLPLRAWAGGIWVYGEPGTWAGFGAQFFGDEAAHFVGLPGSLAEFAGTIQLINTVLITDLTLPGLVIGIIGLLRGLRQESVRRASLALLVSGGLSYLFHITFYTDVLSALILQITLSAAFGWWVLLHELRRDSPVRAGLLLILPVIGAVILFAHNVSFIAALTRDETGLQTIILLEDAPPGSTVMIAWGPRHFAAGFARDVLGELQHIELVDHKADFRALAAGLLVTPDYTFHNQPPDWWQDQIGAPVYLRAAAPYLVQIDTQPEQAARAGGELRALREQVVCTGDRILLSVDWYTPERPTEDRSVFVHLLNSSGALIAQADQFAPVYSWRPLTGWTANEVIHDIYVLPDAPEAASIRYGLYYQMDDGAFVNVLEREVRVDC